MITKENLKKLIVKQQLLKKKSQLQFLGNDILLYTLDLHSQINENPRCLARIFLIIENLRVHYFYIHIFIEKIIQYQM